MELWNRNAMRAAERRQRQVANMHHRRNAAAEQRCERWNTRAMAAEERFQVRLAAWERRSEYRCQRDMAREDRRSHQMDRGPEMFQLSLMRRIEQLLVKWKRAD